MVYNNNTYVHVAPGKCSKVDPYPKALTAEQSMQTPYVYHKNQTRTSLVEIGQFRDLIMTLLKIVYIHMWTQ